MPPHHIRAMVMRHRTRHEASRWGLYVIAALLLVIVAFAIFAWRPSIEAVTPPARDSFDANVVQRGAKLAAVGNCYSCHTASAGPVYAGGVAVPTPFGTIYSTNITPDPETGIGTWSESAFDRAMRQGVSRNGSHLYPAFPYDHFTQLSDDDLKALYAFFMTRRPVTTQAPDNDLNFPLGFRPLLAGWKLLYLDDQRFVPDSAQSADWNRGAYLVRSLGHCSACHTPRNVLGAEDGKQYFGGGEAEGWYAPALNANSPSPHPWTTETLTAYLSTGLAPNHAIAAGPMQEVVATLKNADEQDRHAVAVYVMSYLAQGQDAQQRRAQKASERAALGTLSEAQPSAGAGAVDDEAMMKLGASVYADACARCHDKGRQTSSGGALPMPLAIAVYDPDARNLIHIIRDGVVSPVEQAGRIMPAFAEILTDEQLSALVAYLRRYAADAPPWPDVAATIKEIKSP